MYKAHAATVRDGPNGVQAVQLWPQGIGPALWDGIGHTRMIPPEDEATRPHGSLSLEASSHASRPVVSFLTVSQRVPTPQQKAFVHTRGGGGDWAQGLGGWLC